MLPQFAALDANWRETLRLQLRAVVFCWAEWSPVDKVFGANLARVIPDYEAQFAFFTADLDDATLVPFFSELSVVSCPFLLLCDRGAAIGWSYGYLGDDRLRAQLDAWLQT